MDQKYTNDAMFYYYKDLDENLAWLTQKTEESKCNFEGGSNYGMIWSTYIITMKEQCDAISGN